MTETSHPAPPVVSTEARRLTVAALLIVLFLGALDQTVVSTAMPRIVAQLKGLELYSWVTTVYLLSSTVMVPIWGKLGDQFGRKGVLVWGVMIFITGSVLCGLAGEFRSLPLLGGGMVQLIVFRSLQGIGGGALFTSAFAVIADLYPPRERGKLSGYFGGMFGLSSIIGPLLGGFFTEHGTVSLFGHVVEGWRWVFYINLPLAGLALFMIQTRMPALRAGHGGRVDVVGALLILTGFIPLLLALSWGGHTYAWASPTILGLLAVTVVSLTLFVLVESRVTQPILPIFLFKIPTFTWANIASFILSMSFIGVVTYLPLYLQLGLGVPATKSGIALLPMMLGIVSSAMTCGRIVTRTGRYKPVMVVGGALLIGAIFLLTRLGPDPSLVDVGWRMFLLGLALGPAQGIFSMAIQNAVPVPQIGVATATSQFSRQIGSTVGVAIFGAILTQSLSAEMSRRSANGAGLSLDQLQQVAISSAAGAGHTVVDPMVKVAFAAAMSDLFWAGLLVSAFGLVSILFVPELPLRRHLHPEPVAEPGEGFERPEENDQA